MNLASRVSSVPKTREWTSFRGNAVPLSSDPFAMGEDFIRALHHRLCQPLTALSCTLELMQIGREADHRLNEQLHSAVEQADRIMSLMASFRQLFEAAVPAGGASSCLNHVLNEVVDDLRPVAEDKEIVLALEINGNNQLMMGESQLRQSLWSLLQNCIELTPIRGMVKVKATSMQLTVDDGCAASSTEFANMFDPFSFCKSCDDSSRVSNLPLAVLQRVMLAHGGSISAGSGPAGRRFELRFPRSESSLTD